MIVIGDRALRERERLAAGSLRPLAASLASDLERVIAADPPVIAEKARLTRTGGRCRVDGTPLAFDPFSPDRHRCERCGREYAEPADRHWWLMSYHLWLAERAVHASLLFRLTGEPRHARFARSVLAGYAESYEAMPNRDNVLGPSRPFFSTYLESIWTLHLAIAADALAGAGDGEIAALVLERIAMPSAELIESFDEGQSNRQVWNLAAMLAVARLGRQNALLERTVLGERGLVSLVRAGVLGDGSWYEGENYHQFAHRGLWYGITIAEAAGIDLPADALALFDGGFAIPFLTALPDFTAPSRRDSPWAVSLRQWRFAESAELGFARTGDARLLGALGVMYAGDLARGDTGRSRSAAESERNTPAVALTRADLGWRSLLYALPELPPLRASSPPSVLLEGQGLAIFRRNSGGRYVALDYGHGGGGHGHPDRLNLMLVDGRRRWLDDPGTGSYVDPSLHWYRSTLAHNAPLADGRSQWRTRGALLAHEERGGAGWVEATAQISGSVDATRTVVVMPGYIVDLLRWTADRDVNLDLPIHADGEIPGARWETAGPGGSDGAEDGFRFVERAERSDWSHDSWVRLDAREGNAQASAWLVSPEATELWRAHAPGPPGTGSRRFHLVRAHGRTGSITTVWDVEGVVKSVAKDGEAILVTLASERHRHRRTVGGWRVELQAQMAASSIDLGGLRTRISTPRMQGSSGGPRIPALELPKLDGSLPGQDEEPPLRFELGGLNYRRSELDWSAAGEPTAAVSLWRRGKHLVVHAEVHKADVCFAPEEPASVLDNEDPLIHGDGMQLHVVLPPAAPGAEPRRVSWLFAPTDRGDVRIRTGSDSPPARAVMERSEDGYVLRADVDLSPVWRDDSVLELAIGINDMAPGRERRRGQLVLVTAADEYVYLQGDRLPPHHFLPIAIEP